MSGVAMSPLTSRLEWNTSSGTAIYGLQVSTNYQFTTTILDENSITELYYDIPEDLLNWARSTTGG